MNKVYEVYAEPLSGGSDSQLLETFGTKREAQVFIENVEFNCINTEHFDYCIEERVVND